MNSRIKIALASILVGLVAVATGLSTLAWFNGSSSLMISNFNITLADRSDKNLLISTDNEHFYQTLYMRDEKTVESEENKNVGQYLPDVSPFRAVSTMFQDEWFKPSASDDEKALLPVFRRNVTNPGNLQKELYTSVNDYPEASAGFLRQELYFKSEAGGRTIANYTAIPAHAPPAGSLRRGGAPPVAPDVGIWMFRRRSSSPSFCRRGTPDVPMKVRLFPYFIFY